jgi:myo-inositol-1(or 4)-monophosphatase
LHAALVGTGQARHDETLLTYRLMSQSIYDMLQAGLVVKTSVPATLQLIHVAAGRADGFWQHSQVRVGLLAGALLVAEAGGTITDIHGNPWDLASQSFLATAPKIHTASVATLSRTTDAALTHQFI